MKCYKKNLKFSIYFSLLFILFTFLGCTLSLKDVKENDVAEAIRYMYSHSIKVLPLKSESKLHFIIHLFSSGRSASVEIKDSHTNVVGVIKNGNVLRTYSNANSASEREKDAKNKCDASVGLAKNRLLCS